MCNFIFLDSMGRNNTNAFLAAWSPDVLHFVGYTTNPTYSLTKFGLGIDFNRRISDPRTFSRLENKVKDEIKNSQLYYYAILDAVVEYYKSPPHFTQTFFYIARIYHTLRKNATGSFGIFAGLGPTAISKSLMNLRGTLSYAKTMYKERPHLTILTADLSKPTPKS
ncbi:uncharacterized protein LOC144167030 [Haemaphysalis longicornis]